jgi:calmodulin
MLRRLACFFAFSLCVPSVSLAAPSSDQIDEYQEAFALFDKDASGNIDASELGKVMSALGQSPTDAELMNMIEEVDASLDGRVDFMEFVSMMEAKKSATDSNQEIASAFDVFDSDGNQFVNAQELTTVMANLGEMLTPQEVSQMILEADIDGDALIDFAEFNTMMAE